MIYDSASWLVHAAQSDILTDPPPVIGCRGLVPAATRIFCLSRLTPLLRLLPAAFGQSHRAYNHTHTHATRRAINRGPPPPPRPAPETVNLRDCSPPTTLRQIASGRFHAPNEFNCHSAIFLIWRVNTL